jgi:hypothetical protein
MLHCYIASAKYIARRRSFRMSKQLSLSSAFAVLAMAAFVLSATPLSQRAKEMGAPTLADAPHLSISLKGL